MNGAEQRLLYSQNPGEWSQLASIFLFSACVFLFVFLMLVRLAILTSEVYRSLRLASSLPETGREIDGACWCNAGAGETLVASYSFCGSASRSWVRHVAWVRRVARLLAVAQGNFISLFSSFSPGVWEFAWKAWRQQMSLQSKGGLPLLSQFFVLFGLFGVGSHVFQAGPELLILLPASDLGMLLCSRLVI